MLGEIKFDHPLFVTARRSPVQRLHQDPFLEAPAHRCRKRWARRSVLARFETGDAADHREIRRQGPAGGLGERLAAGRQPARAVVEIRSVDDGAARSARSQAPGCGEPFRCPIACRCRSSRDRPRSLTVHKPDGAAVSVRARRRVLRGDRPAGPVHAGRRPTAHGRSRSTSTRWRARQPPLNVETLEQFGLPAGEPCSEGRSTMSSSGRCTTSSSKIARSSGGG